MNTKELVNFDELETTTSNDTIEKLMLEEAKRIYESNKKVGLPTRYFKENYKTIFKRESTNSQPRLNKAMNALANNKLVQIKKVSGRNYIRYLPVQERTSKTS